MKKTTQTLYFFLILIFSTMTLEAGFWDMYSPSMQNLQGIRIYEGDRDGSFSGDLVAILSDGSGWKIHPDHPDIFNSWEEGDWIHIDIRTSWYWFKREHKFLLHNYTRSETVKAMLIQHADSPLCIVDTDSHLGIVDTDSHLETKFVTVYEEDEEGNEHIVERSETGSKLQKDLYMSDGSIWTIDETDDFKIGDYVHVGVNAGAESFQFFLICGVEKTAKWCWTSVPAWQ